MQVLLLLCYINQIRKCKQKYFICGIYYFSSTFFYYNHRFVYKYLYYLIIYHNLTVMEPKKYF